MLFRKSLNTLLISVIVAIPAFAEMPQLDASSEWLALGETQVDESAYYAPEATAPPAKCPPLPFHTIEGVAGCAITPMAYLSNPGPEGTTIGLPTTSFTYVHAGSKSVQTFAITETFFRRLEVGYAVSRFYMGSLPHVIRKTTGIDIDRNDVYLHHFNARAMLIEENSFDLPLPAVTVGAHFKYNDGIRSIDNHLGGALGMIGFERSNGTDFVLTASKTFPNVLFGRPVMTSVGLRNSQAAQLGYLGFSDHWTTTLEANVVCCVTDWLAVGYEFRQKTNPYHHIEGLVGEEHNWHAICAGWSLGSLC